METRQSDPLLARIRTPKTAGVLAALALAILAAKDIGLAKAAGPDLRPKALPRCYDEPDQSYLDPYVAPLPKQKNYKSKDAYWQAFDEWDKKYGKIQDQEDKSYPVDNPIHLQANADHITGDPMNLNPVVDKQVAGALVKVETTDGWYGSGVITTDEHGQEVVITAAHVPSNEPLKNLRVVDGRHHIARVDGGCSMYEGDGKFLPYTYEHSSTFDISVLKITHHIGKDALSLATTPANRGDWVFFKNYQNRAALNRPDTYGAIVTENDQKHLDFFALTGLQYWRKREYVIHGGASGGPVVNQLGEIVGISVASSPFPYESKETLKAEDNITISGLKEGHRTGLLPQDAALEQERALEIALASPRA